MALTKAIGDASVQHLDAEEVLEAEHLDEVHGDVPDEGPHPHHKGIAPATAAEVLHVVAGVAVESIHGNEGSGYLSQAEGKEEELGGLVSVGETARACHEDGGLSADRDLYLGEHLRREGRGRGTYE